MKNAKKTVIIIVFAACLIYILKNIVETNINLYVIGSLLIVCEIIFDVSIALILFASGFHKIRFKDIVKRDYKKINFKKPIVRLLWLVNRIIWLVPLVYLLVSGWGQLTIASVLILLLEIVITLVVGIVVSKNLM